MLGLKRGRPMVLAVILAAAVRPPAAEAQAPPDYGPDVLVISTPVLAALERGLRTEIALRESFRKELAALKTKAQYTACYGEAMSSPESTKLTEALILMPENLTPGQRQRRTARAGQHILAFLLAKCGPDPVEFNDTWRARRLEEIQRQAANAAGPIPSQ